MSGEDTLPLDETAPEKVEEVAPQVRRVERYTLLERIGSGTAGAVFTAYDPRLDRRVALKLLAAGDDLALTEARALAKLSHGNVVAVHDVGVGDGHAFVAMEFIDGPTLSRWLADSTNAGDARRWQAVMPVLLGAGRGLAAAHAAGLVHRDFKPGNVLVKEDRIGMVVDFGLATPCELADSVTESAPRPDRDAPRVAVRVVGTPAYMAPEVFNGMAADARSDQFGFCVTAYEALLGRRPFPGATSYAVMFSVTRGLVVDDRDPIAAPAWIRAALVRGLAHDPAQRWPSMDALLDALARSPGRRRVVVTVLGGTAAAVGGLITGALVAEPEPDCNAAASAIDATWNATARAELAGGLIGTGERYAPQTVATVNAELDAYAASWRETHVYACNERTLGVSSDLLFDRRIACLGRGDVALSTLLALLSSADAGLVAAAVDATRRLPSPQACRHVEALLAGRATPEDPALAMQADAIRAELARASVESIAGHRADASARAGSAVTAARTLAFEPVLLEALLEHARTLQQVDPALRDERLGEAWSVALASGDDLSAADIAVMRVQGFAQTAHPGPIADDDVRTAEALLARVERLGLATTTELDLQLRHGRGHIALRRNDAAGAVTIFRSLYNEARSRWGTEDVRTQRRAHALAMAVQATGDFAEAAALFEVELRVLARDLGPDHPSVASARGNLGLMLRHLGRFDDAIEEIERALAAYEGLAHYDVEAATAHANLAETLYAAGRPGLAVEHYRQSHIGLADGSDRAEGPLRRVLNFAAALLASDGGPPNTLRAKHLLSLAADNAVAIGAPALHSRALRLLALAAIHEHDYDLAVELAGQSQAVHPSAHRGAGSLHLASGVALSRWHRNGPGDRTTALDVMTSARAQVAPGATTRPEDTAFVAAVDRWLDDPTGPPPSVGLD